MIRVAREEVDESSSEPSGAAVGEEELDLGLAPSALRPSHELYAGFIPQARKLYDMLGYAYELAPEASSAPGRHDERGFEEDELLRDIFVSSARFFQFKMRFFSGLFTLLSKQCERICSSASG